MKMIHTSGKRKRAVARACLKQGNGKIRINGLSLANYEPESLRMKIMEPLVIAGDASSKVDIDVKIAGGGMSSQAESARLAIAKLLVEFTKSDKLKKEFNAYDSNLLVADVRRKEASKPNRHGKARAKRQKSYR